MLRPKNLIRFSGDSILDHLGHLMRKTYFAHDLVWPLLVAGTESQEESDKQNAIEQALLGVIRATGSLDRRRVLPFLQMYWHLDLDRHVSWIHVAWTRPIDCSFMII
jgi:hypothetical protein